MTTHHGHAPRCRRGAGAVGNFPQRPRAGIPQGARPEAARGAGAPGPRWEGSFHRCVGYRTSVISLFDMQLLYRNPLDCCEHAAFMPLFNNPLIIDHYTNAPFTTSQFNDLSKKLVYVGELFTSVCRHRYYGTAEIPPITYTEQIFKDRRQIERKYRHSLTPYQY